MVRDPPYETGSLNKDRNLHLNIGHLNTITIRSNKSINYGFSVEPRSSLSGITQYNGAVHRLPLGGKLVDKNNVINLPHYVQDEPTHGGTPSIDGKGEVNESITIEEGNNGSDSYRAHRYAFTGKLCDLEINGGDFKRDFEGSDSYQVFINGDSVPKFPINKRLPVSERCCDKVFSIRRIRDDRLEYHFSADGHIQKSVAMGASVHVSDELRSQDGDRSEDRNQNIVRGFVGTNVDSYEYSGEINSFAYWERLTDKREKIEIFDEGKPVDPDTLGPRRELRIKSNSQTDNSTNYSFSVRHNNTSDLPPRFGNGI